jgi:hypothetical protein
MELQQQNLSPLAHRLIDASSPLGAKPRRHGRQYGQPVLEY